MQKIFTVTHEGLPYNLWKLECDQCKQAIDTTREPYIRMFRELELIHPSGFNSNITFPNMPKGYVEDYHLDCFDGMSNVTVEEIEDAVKLTEIREKDEAYDKSFMDRIQAVRTKHKLEKTSAVQSQQVARYLKERTKVK